MKAVAPSVFFVACISVVRGYYQGKSNMLPTAMSQLVEALGKLFLGLDQLAHRGGQHVGLALIVTAHNRDAGDKEYRRCDRLHRQNGCRVFDEVTQPRRTEEQERRAQRTQRNKDQSGDTHDRTNLTIASEGIGPVSYTHLDVYKRQVLTRRSGSDTMDLRR